MVLPRSIAPPSAVVNRCPVHHPNHRVSVPACLRSHACTLISRIPLSGCNVQAPENRCRCRHGVRPTRAAGRPEQKSVLPQDPVEMASSCCAPSVGLHEGGPVLSHRRRYRSVLHQPHCLALSSSRHRRRRSVNCPLCRTR